MSVAVPAWAQSPQTSADSLAEAFGKVFGTSAAQPSSPDTPASERAPRPRPSAIVAPLVTDRFLLSGVVLMESRKMALIQDLGTGAPQTALLVHIGDAIGEYRLSDVAPDRVTLSGPTGPVVVLLSTGGTGGALQAPPQARVSPTASAPVSPTPSAPVSPPPRALVSPAVSVSDAPAAATDASVSREVDQRQLKDLKKDLKNELNQLKRQENQLKRQENQLRRAGKGGRNAAGGPTSWITE